jgi:hypothetical protein
MMTTRNSRFGFANSMRMFLFEFTEGLAWERVPNIPESNFSIINITNQTVRQQRIARNQNKTAMLCFILDFIMEGIMGLINRAVTREWLGGLDFTMYRPVNPISKVKKNRISIGLL